MNVLSVFDGCSMARLALERAGIPSKQYFASEIDKYAIQISRKNYPDIIHVGDVEYVGKTNDSPNFDLLIGGSPCQGFSFASKGRLNFDDPRSKLFFEYVRILKEFKPKYFLFENVRMKQECQDIISEHLGVEPIAINSNLVSAQNRYRLYWTNIPVESLPEDKGIMLKDILLDDAQEPMLSNIYGGFKEKKPRVHFDKSVTIRTASGGGHIPSVTLRNHALDGSKHRKLTPLECERLQTLPHNYTEGVSNTQRYKMIGNGFTVDVVAHILKGIK